MFYNYASFILLLLGILAGATGYYLDYICRADCEEWLWLGFTAILSASGFTIGRLIQRLSQSNHTDYLTGIWNRRYFYVRLNEELSRVNRKQRPLCIAMIDIDGFKAVNDIYGHAVGDCLLVEFGTILKKYTRTTDVVARFGGDEFAIIFSETSLENTLEVMERIRAKVEASFTPYKLTMSAGVVPFEPDLDTKTFMIKADRTLYKAKNQKNSIITAANYENY